MIAESSYLCGSSDQPAQAVMACTQQGCASFSLCCGRNTCACKSLHPDHYLLFLDSVVKKAAQKVQLPEYINKLEKTVGELIDGFIKQMEMVKNDHCRRMKEYMEKQTGDNVLRRRLAYNEELDRE